MSLLRTSVSSRLCCTFLPGIHPPVNFFFPCIQAVTDREKVQNMSYADMERCQVNQRAGILSTFGLPKGYLMVDFRQNGFQQEVHMSDRNTTVKAGALLLIAGGIIGAGVALLFAPQSGKATRKDISRYARKAKRRAEEVVDDFSDSISKMVDAVGEKAADILDKGVDMAHDSKKEILKAIEDGQVKLEKQRSRLARFLG
jgi:gas vesicle protein